MWPIRPERVKQDFLFNTGKCLFKNFQEITKKSPSLQFFRRLHVLPTLLTVMFTKKIFSSISFLSQLNRKIQTVKIDSQQIAVYSVNIYEKFSRALQSYRGSRVVCEPFLRICWWFQIRPTRKFPARDLSLSGSLNRHGCRELISLISFSFSFFLIRIKYYKWKVLLFF